MPEQLCGVCRQPGADAGYWCGEPICAECADELREREYDPVVF